MSVIWLSRRSRAAWVVLQGHRLQLCVAQGKAQQGQREAIDEEYGGNAGSWEELEKGAKTIGQQANAQGCENRPK